MDRYNASESCQPMSDTAFLAAVFALLAALTLACAAYVLPAGRYFEAAWVDAVARATIVACAFGIYWMSIATGWPASLLAAVATFFAKVKRWRSYLPQPDDAPFSAKQSFKRFLAGIIAFEGVLILAAGCALSVQDCVVLASFALGFFGRWCMYARKQMLAEEAGVRQNTAFWRYRRPIFWVALVVFVATLPLCLEIFPWTWGKFAACVGSPIPGV